MYKIIGTDNYNRDAIADVLVADSIKHEELGKKMVEALNAGADDLTPRWYVLVPADYKLWRGMEELV